MSQLIDQFLVSTGKLRRLKDVEKMAEEYGLHPAVALAVIEVETIGQGFYTGTMIPVVRFENHKFSEFTKRKYDISNPDLSSRTFTNKYNKRGIAEFERFCRAAVLDREAAIKATSWGLGQVMGFNHELCGVSLEKLVDMSFSSEMEQLTLMFEFLKNHPKNLIKVANALQFETFALHYNGKNYAQNDYHNKLIKSYSKHVSRY